MPTPPKKQKKEPSTGELMWRGLGGFFSGVGDHVASGAVKKKDQYFSTKKDEIGRPQGILPGRAAIWGKKAKSWWPGNWYNDKELARARDEYSNIKNILSKVQENKYLELINFNYVDNNPLSTYKKAEETTTATFAQKPKTVKEPDTEEQKTARAAVTKGYEEFMAKKDSSPTLEAKEKALDETLKAANEKLGDKLNHASRLAKDPNYNPQSVSRQIHKLGCDQTKFLKAHAKARLDLKKEKTTAYFDSLATKVDAAADETEYPDEVKDLIKIGKIKLVEPDKDAKKRTKAVQITDQLKDLEKEQLGSLDTQSESNQKKADEERENLATAYYQDLSNQARLAQILKYQSTDAVNSAAAADTETDAAVELSDGQAELSRSFLVKVAKEQDNILKGPLGSVLFYNEESDSFVADLSGLNETQKQATIDFQVQTLFAEGQNSNGLRFLAKSDHSNPQKNGQACVEISRMQIRAVSEYEGQSLEKQEFKTTGPKIENGKHVKDSSGNPAYEEQVFKLHPDKAKGEKPLRDLFSSPDNPELDKKLKAEYEQLLARDKVTNMSPQEKFKALKEVNAERNATHSPKPGEEAGKLPESSFK